MFFVASMLMFSSCVQDEIENVLTSIEESAASSEQPTLRSGGLEYGYHIVGTLPFSGETTHGRPGVTYYKFFVANPLSGTTGVDIIFTAPDGANYTHSMALNSSGNWYKEMTLSQHGRYTFTYKVYRNGAYSTYTPDPNYIDNTYVNFSGSPKKLIWPFGADGSSWGSKGSWYISCGPGQNEHTGSTEQYSVDWTKTGGSNGATVKSPLDGRVVRKRFHVDGGNQIGIEQTIGNTTYAFQVGHLQGLLSSIQIGDYVRAGETILGYIGSTGNAQGPHAHMTLRTGNITSGTSVAFEFSANP
ncbi:MAG: M23 family metallopeptidase [Candidatus Peribacteria bacterium]|nr:M23 family metallopeptidase [Candidatus Peribacteria bacterium]